MKVKICGMREPYNISQVMALRPDFMGFIFYAPSPRYCGRLSRETVVGLNKARIEPVAVTVNLDMDALLVLNEEHGFTTFQLHGEESPLMCSRLKALGFKVIKAISVNNEESLREAHKFVGLVDYILLDTSTPSKGGSGKKFDWNILSAYDIPQPFLLSGGIGEDDAHKVLAIDNPHFVGVDLNSRFEVSPGLKNVDSLSRFLGNLNR
ncbi:MAG: phosphoribosylanthranilate isomerase [Clostridiales bacterium]|nr:phosphoribosylanthranilate isomerase [Clostridiales bacterium]